MTMMAVWFLAGEAVAAPEPPVQECDRLAAHPLDAQSVVSGVSFSRLNASLAVSACLDARQAYPDAPRFMYQHGRAMQRAGDAAGARAAFKLAGAKDYAQAWLSLGQMAPSGPILDVTAAKRHARRGRLVLEGLAKSGNIRAAHVLGLLLLTSKAIPHKPKTAYRWIRHAARAGHPPALTTLARMQHRGIGTRAHPYSAEKTYLKAIAFGQPGLRVELGGLYRQGGRLKKAEATFILALNELEAATHNDSQSLVRILAQLGNVQVSLKRFAEAVVSLERALAIVETDPNQVQSAFALAIISELGKARLGEERDSIAESLFQRALSLGEGKYGRDSPKLTSVLIDLGKARHRLHKPLTAETALLRALAIQETHDGPEGAGVLEVLQQLRWVYFWIDTKQTDTRKPGPFRDKLQPLLRRLLSLEQKIYGPKHPFLALTLHQLAKTLLHEGLDYYGGGDVAEAPELLRRALEIAERAGPQSITKSAEIRSELLQAYQKLGDHRHALPMLEKRLAVHDTGDQPMTAHRLDRLLLDLAGSYLALGDPVAAEPPFERAMSVRRKITPDPAERAKNMKVEAQWLLSDLTGRKRELILRGVIEALEEQPEPDLLELAEALLNLGVVRLRNADPRFQAILERFEIVARKLPEIEKSQEVAMLLRFTEALVAVRAWDPATEMVSQINAIGEPIQWQGLPYMQVKQLQAKIFLGQGQLNDALPLASEVFAESEKFYPEDSTFLLPILKLVGRIELARGALDSADRFLSQAREIVAKVPNSIWAKDIDLFVMSAARAYRVHDTEGGDALMSQAKAITATTGLEGAATANLYMSWAALLEETGDLDKAVMRSRQGVLITQKNSDLGAAASVGLDDARRTNAQYAAHFQTHALRLSRLIGENTRRRDRVDLKAEIFNYVQRAQSTGAAAAIDRMAARFAARDNALGRLIRSRQDVVNQRDRLAQKLGGVLDQAASELTAQLETRLHVTVRELDGRLAGIDKKILIDFPDYGELARPRPVPLATTQSLLQPGEGLLTFMLGGEGGLAVLVTRDQVLSHPIKASRVAVAERVEALRWGLDPTEVSSVEDLLTFDAREAHALFTSLLGPLSTPVMTLSHLIVVPDGSLQSLPLGVLLTAPPLTARFLDFAAFRAAPWLARAVAISVLPAVSGLRALRHFARESGASKPFLGIGDPLLLDHPGPMETPKPDLRGGSALVWLTKSRARPDASAMFRGGRADIRAIKNLASLPDSAVELASMADSLGGSSDDLYLRERAVEPLIRGDIKLRDYRVLALATHGILAGELAGLSEPALVLTPPDKASDENDGLLTASEITDLDLDADWVILSACNTAGPDGTPGAEGLSGLARAFFYAGARTLFVSHWPVVSETTVKMTTGMLAALAATPEIGKAEAHRRAILAVMGHTTKEMFAHPLFWAPFVVVGDGGATASKETGLRR
jgi:CHAT domain-containing protein/tetratricopeptide (TPR) repeat protein